MILKLSAVKRHRRKAVNAAELNLGKGKLKACFDNNTFVEYFCLVES